MGDVYETLTYLIVIIVSAIVMIAWLKRKAAKKKHG